MTTITSWDNNMRPYYHFTSLESLYKIHETGKIRLTSCNSAKNAAVEIMALYSSIKNIIDNNSDLYRQLLQDYSINETDSLIEKFIEQRVRSYIACFSLFDENNEYQEILNASYMWKFYADSTNGVVIKFNHLCFPYIDHGSNGEGDSSGKIQRLSEKRIACAIYDKDKLEKGLRDPNMHLFVTDVYKPKFCELEKEIRLLVYLRNRNEISKLSGISESSTQGLELPEFIYYDFADEERQQNIACIMNIFCREQATYNKLCDVFDKKRVVLIR